MPDAIEVALELLRSGRCKVIAEAARNAGCSRSTLSERWNAERGEAAAGKYEDPDKGTMRTVTKPGELPPEWTPESLAGYYKIDLDEWEPARIRGNLWGDPADPRNQLRIDWIRKSLLIQPVDPGSWTPPPKPKARKDGEHLDGVVISDHHAPEHERVFHRLFVDYLRDEQPDLIEVNGDLLDFSTISRHRERDGAACVNTCLQAGFNILRDYREVCPDAQIRLKRGNHEERLQHLILDNARGLHNITPADDDIPALSLQRLLHLDELHVDYVDEDWEQAKTRLSRKLTARHGFSTAKNAGEQILDRLAGSTVQGHDHRAGITLRTEHSADEEDPLRVRMAIQGGCACIIPGGLQYVNGGEPNWQNAVSAFRVYPDGDFHGSLGIYVPERFLAPNGKRYR